MSSETASKKYRQQHKRPNPVKNPGPPHRKIAAKLDARVKDYAAMVEKHAGKVPMGAFHMPGSRQR